MQQPHRVPVIIRDAHFDPRGVTVSLQHKLVHSNEKPFVCDQPGCTFRAKTNSILRKHQKRVHLKIRGKWCHVCDKRFYAKSNLRVHMMSQHQTKDHDIDECDDCVPCLKKDPRLSLAQRASHKRRTGGGGTHSTSANMLGIEHLKAKGWSKEWEKGKRQ